MNVFDIVGPVMIGPSSSHTAGAVRMGRVARLLLGEAAQTAEIVLHGSFAKTYRGHGTDKALVGGILGLAPDDERIRFSLDLAQDAGLSIDISTTELDNAHPNTAQIALTGKSGKRISVQSASVGGGNILINQVNGLQVEFTGQYPTIIVLHRDLPGTIAGVAEVVALHDANISHFSSTREEKGGNAVMTIELDGNANEAICTQLMALPNIINATLLQPV